MAKTSHEIRDPIHVFIRLDSQERKVLDSRPFQRLRYIHQLALTYLLYPGATHRRFEHSLGVMELASRVFDIVTDPAKVSDAVKELFPPINSEDERRYWRRVLRMAALCHDIGHLPFSHAAEEELFPPGWDHERMTMELIQSDEMKEIWENARPPLSSEDIVKLALGPKKAKELQFDDWETMLSEIIVGDSFGVDRMDYLLRDSYHAGVAYGRFDHHRLIDTLRILPPPLYPYGNQLDNSKEPSLGVEKGGIHSAEALLLARYFMFTQVYCHHVRRIYDIHLKDFLIDWLGETKYPTDIDAFLKLTDNEITSDLRDACLDAERPGHIHADRIINRKHFKLLYTRNPTDFKINSDAANLVKEAAVKEYGEDKVRLDGYSKKGGITDFPVLSDDGKTVLSALQESQVLAKIPSVVVNYVFVDPNIRDEALRWFNKGKAQIITPQKEEQK
ncbi:MAG TPA: HD domain-containing protein [Desulfobacterales bacterium]|nr:HD domain-containing protein [Desulfobacterales bacterium]